MGGARDRPRVVAAAEGLTRLGSSYLSFVAASVAIAESDDEIVTT